MDDRAELWRDDAGRHRVTVLFADIHASTRMIQHLDAEAAADIMEPALRVMIAETERHGGVPASRGDGIIAIFGAPSICEDHALRACLSAVAIRDRLATELPGLKSRIGIHSGEVVISHYRIGDAELPQASGLVVHVAARLEQTAKPGLICMSHATLDLTRGFVRTRALRPVAAKGVDRPVARVELLDVDASADLWSVRAAKGLGSMVNREVEAAMLQAMLARAEPGGPRVVQVVGAAGIGKSRLLHEFLTCEATGACAVVRFSADRHRQYLAFHPITEWLREAMDIGPVTSRREAVPRIAASLSALGLDPVPASPLVQRLLGFHEPLVGEVAAVSALDRQAAFATVAAIVGAQAGERRLVIACDDLDHFDTATLELLDVLLQPLAGTNPLIVATCRAEAKLAVSIPIRVIELGPLTRRQTMQVLEAVAPGIGERPRLSDAIVDKAGGNPLFVEEVASLVLRDAGATGHVDGERRADGDVDGAISIPDRVQALIADHLTRLSADLRRLIRLCAVVGLDVPVRLLSVLTGVTEQAIVRQLAALDAEQLLQQTRVYPAPQYSFRHALVRDVVYSSMLTVQRRGIHASIVKALEEHVDLARTDQRVYDLAHHALAARLWRPAFDYLRQAGRSAVDKFAYQEAYGHFSRAQEISREMPETPELARERLAVALDIRLLLLELDRYQELEPLLHEAEATAESLGDRTSHIRVIGWRAHVSAMLGKLTDAAEHGQRAHQLARALGDLTLITASGHYLGQAHFYLGELQRADEMLASVESPAAEVPSGPGVAVGASMPVLVRGTRGLALSFLGRFATAEHVLAMARRFADSTRRPYDSAFICSVDAFLNIQREAARDSLVAVEDGLSLAEEYRLTQLALPLRIARGHVDLMHGDAAAARRTFSNALTDARARRRHFMQISAGLGLALADLRLGNACLGEEHAAEALVLADSFGFRALKVAALRTLGRVMLHRRQRRQAARHLLRSAVALATELGMAPELARCHDALVDADVPDAADHRARADSIRAEF